MALEHGRKPNAEKLLSFGFVPDGSRWTYHTVIAQGQFAMTVTAAKNGDLQTGLRDVETGEPYVLHRTPDAAGAFVGMVRRAHDEVLQEIENCCFDTDVFQSSVAQAVIAYARRTYGSEPEYLWKTFPRNAVLRRTETGKWYGVLLTASKRKVGLESDELAEMLNLHMQPAELEQLIDHRRYFPGYHMNKQHWYTVLLDGSVPAEELYDRIDESYRLAVK